MNHPDRPYYPALDGLRGLACLLIVVYHNFGFINKYVFFGWLGVDIFFVLSGFLITDILLNSFGKPGFLRNFYIRRMLRIFPLYYLALLIFLVVLPKINDLPVSLDYYVDHQVWLWTYLQNWLFSFNPSPDQNALNHLWSLAVEEQFYLFWPLVILVLRKPKILLVVITLVLLLTVGLRIWIWINRIEGLAYFNLYTFTRIDGICIGCMIALLQRINPRFLSTYSSPIVLLFAGLNFLFYFINRSYHFSFPFLPMIGYTSFAMIFGLLVYNIVNSQSGILTIIFNNPLLRAMGMVSYGCYMFHWPLYLILAPGLEQWAVTNISFISAPFFASVAASSMAYLLGFLSYRFYELPFLRMKKHFL